MAIKVIVNIANASDWIAAEATARFRLDRDTTVAFPAPTEVVTTVLVAGTDRYEVWDAGGTTASFYRFRIENDADSGISGWRLIGQPIEEQPIATLAGVKQRLGTTSATDDDVLERYVRRANTAIIRRLGYYPGPSTATTLTLDGIEAVRGATRLWVPGGFRSLTKLETAGSFGGAFTEVAATTYVYRPHASELVNGEPYSFIQLVTGTFPVLYDDVRLTGTFGWASPPADLVEVAEAWAVRSWKARATGDADVLGSDEMGNMIISDRMPISWRQVIDSYRLWPVV